MKCYKEELEKRGLVPGDYHLPYNPKLVPRAKGLRKYMTQSERKLWYAYLRNFKYRVLRQRPIDHYIVDFYCPQLKLVIEIDGETHFREEGKQYDEERTAVLEGYGLHIIRFLNTEVTQNLEGVCVKIETIANPSVRSFGADTPLKKGGTSQVPLSKGDKGGSIIR